MRRARRQGGFTLAELLMTVVIASLFATALYSFFFSGSDMANSHQSQAKAQAAARTAIERFTRDARQAISADGGLNGPVQSLSTTSVVMYVDNRRDPSAGQPRPQRVRYMLSGTQLVRQVANPVGSQPPYSYGAYGPPVVLAEPVVNGSSAVFGAVDAAGRPLAMPGQFVTGGPSGVAKPNDIAGITIRLLVGQRTGARPTTTELRTDVTLRNALRR